MKTRKHNASPKSLSKDKLVAYLTLVSLIVVVTVAVFWIQGYHMGSSVSLTSDEIKTPVDPSLVCMVNDAYMGVAQIPVPVNGKTYYGCCQGCVDKLNNLESARIAIDPYSGNPVDKSEAYIVLMNPQGAVAYFESEANYNAFKKN
ncbi:hypothetical protein [Marinoscillum luteum]|uniref:TRASH transcription regulator C-terminal archaeal domain-containing protein n=1 Tax=Marinoscillum luteum TaxID=861051 RepID=A0ABW7NDJ6_9BACT